MTRSKVTIRDVAAKAGVSYQTVSRVINNSENVTPGTRSRVEKAIHELGYHPNAIARFMAKGKTHTIACISPNLTDYTFARIIEGAEIEGRKHGYYLLSSSSPDADTFAFLVDELISSQRAEGLLVINPYADERYNYLPENAPVVLVGARPREEAFCSVALDDKTTGMSATQHLIDCGHKRIALIAGPNEEDCTQDRRDGYILALKKNGIDFDENLVASGDWSASSGFRAFNELSQRGSLPTAVFAQNDQMAVGVISAARELGLSVPDDLAVIGVDDMPLASYFDPPLTTMRQDLSSIGCEAAKLLIKSLEDRECKSEQLLLPAELIIRKSTKKP